MSRVIMLDALLLDLQINLYHVFVVIIHIILVVRSSLRLTVSLMVVVISI